MVGEQSGAPNHVDMEANVNFLLPLADLCCGTMRTSLTAAEILEAKATPIGHSEPAAVFAAEFKRSHRKAEAMAESG